MAVAIAYPVSQQGKRNDLTSANLAEVTGIHSSRLSSARKILRFTPANAPKVMSGELPFTNAVAEAQKIEDASALEIEKERTRKAEEAEAARIKKEADGDEEKRTSRAWSDLKSGQAKNGLWRLRRLCRLFSPQDQKCQNISLLLQCVTYRLRRDNLP